jgi:hypothetical protein
VGLNNATDADLAALKDKQDLLSLIIASGPVTDAGLANLKEMTNLKRLTTPAVR